MMHWGLLYGEMIVVSAAPVVLVGAGAFLIYSGRLSVGMMKEWAAHLVDYVKELRK